ncbi:MAG: galactokinase [Actinobacteria bacterium]|uniref:Unannotated protein n=1 Tax=freshwater metagenome TaxID=449393 RepID=A0A6J7BW52_9ZZZZ|nr:galactokinase [Actinomycetota bacterium]MSW77325.1 galactokinase [Actinomycetota bacterium]MSX54742.1 galactokinase [Actinomycetota bacterium]MSZ82744.1 galactokinase [Actinomycetota bacterium]MTB17646.1 galactokinase [Actinomycetota bacterium]
MSELFPRVRASFDAVFGGPPDLVARAPGRVNLIGEHTDYNDGFVLPVAIGAHTLVAARQRGDSQVNVVAVDFADALSSFSTNGTIAQSPEQPWSDYVRGVVFAMRAAGHELPGADLVIAGNVPQGSGLSSSASVVVAVATAFDAMAALELDPTAIATLAQSCECDFVGTKCGIMDQLVSARGVAGHAVLIDCRSLVCTPIPIPADTSILIVHSGVTRGLADGAYNERRAQCEDAAERLGVTKLRDATVPMLDAARSTLQPLTFQRARHVITENERTLAAAHALRNNDLVTLGSLMASSHDSMRVDFEITLPPVDQLVAELQSLIGPDGGARMTGGGFGGAVVAVMRSAQLPHVLAGLSYRTPSGDRPLVLEETASAGATVRRM